VPNARFISEAECNATVNINLSAVLPRLNTEQRVLLRSPGAELYPELFG